MIDRETMTAEQRAAWANAPCARRRNRPTCVFCGKLIMRDGWLHPKLGKQHAHYQCTPELGWSEKR